MRIGLVSDIHGNVPALEAALSALDEARVDRIVCLGDTVDLGPEPLACVQRLNERGVAMLRGNHDELDEQPDMPMLADLEVWTREILDEATLAALREAPLSLRIEHAGLSLLCVHGTPRSHREGVLAETPSSELEALHAAEDFDVLACGHTHVQLHRREAHRLYVNAGSVGMPFAFPVHRGPPHILPWAELAVVELRPGRVGVELLRVPYDVAEYRARVRRSGMPHAERFLSHWG